MNRILPKKTLLIALGVLVALAVAIPVIVLAVSKAFTAQESVVRTDWEIEAGDVLGDFSTLGVQYADAELGQGLHALRLIPDDVENEGFTFYDTTVQQRLAQALGILQGGRQWTATAPLAVLDPFGTGSNGLYLYFETDLATRVSYTVHVQDEDIPDFTAQAADASGVTYTKQHEFQLIGLVPGMTNEVTLTITGSWGNARQIVRFAVDMPEPTSGYDTRLEVTDGDSDAPQAQGLFAMMRVNGHLGYGFFYDDAGVLRYEMVLEGFGLDRLLFTDDGDILTCVSSSKLARINALGQVEQVYPLDGYELHHDIGFGAGGEVLALAEHAEGETVEDLVLSIHIDTGEVTEILDFSALMESYFDLTRPVQPTDEFFWQAGEWDWIHLNSLLYRQEDDSLIVSSRETSTILKVSGLHGEPAVQWLAGDGRVWAGTEYEALCLEPVGDFVPQYGQHCVEYYADGDTDGVYYLSLYNNNYWAMSSRDDFTLEVAETVGTDLYGDGSESSQMYIYRIDENAGTFELTDSFDVPYSSIVSNASLCGDNWVANSGVSMVFGEYDPEGVLIRQYKYECTMQNYRTFKYDMTGFWFD